MGLIVPRPLLILAVLALVPQLAFSWEEDVHYVLTFWLAEQAGMSRQDADILARGNQSYDDSSHSGAISTVIRVLITGDIGAARDVQRKHFANDALLPSPPLRRVVTPNSPAARRDVEAAIALPTQPANAVFAFGEALHPFQDSWSHQGVPDVPFGVRPNLSVAHPEERGGWRSHDADLTHLHVAEVLEMAEETYRFIQQFLGRNPGLRDGPSRNWSRLDSVVRQLAEAKSKPEKNDWALTNLQEEVVGLSATTVPGFAELRGFVTVFEPPPKFQFHRHMQVMAENVPESSLLAAQQEFLDAWLDSQDIRAAMEFVNIGEIAIQLSDEPFLSDMEGIVEWSEKFLAMQLVADHAQVNLAGHGNPSHEQYSDLPRRAVVEGRFRTAVLGAPEVTFSNIIPIDKEDGLGHDYGIVLRLPNQERDEVAFIWEYVDRSWRISRMIASTH